MVQHSRYERIMTGEPVRYIWNRLDILSSVNGAQRYFRDLFVNSEVPLGEENRDIYINKVNGLAFCIRSARDYFKVTAESNLTMACLTYYYGTLSLLQALLIANVRNTLTLKEVEEFTKRGGHGLKSEALTHSRVPATDAEYLRLTTNGFFYNYLIHTGQKPTGINLDDPQNRIFLDDLLSRIPELRNYYIEIYRKQPNYLAFEYIGYRQPPGMPYDVIIRKEYNSGFLDWPTAHDILGWDMDDKDDINRFTESDDHLIAQYVNVEDMPDARLLYESDLCMESYIKPLLGMKDGLLFHFMFLYQLSIWVRYRPALWREITEGNNDILRPLITNYLIAVERVIPNIVLNRLYDCRFLFAEYAKV